MSRGLTAELSVSKVSTPGAFEEALLGFIITVEASLSLGKDGSLLMIP